MTEPQQATGQTLYSQPQAVYTQGSADNQPQDAGYQQAGYQQSSAGNQPQDTGYQQGGYQQSPAYNQPQEAGYRQAGYQAQDPAYQQPYPPYQQSPYMQPVYPVIQEQSGGRRKKPLIFTLIGLGVLAAIILCFIFLFPTGGKNRVLDNILKAARESVDAGSVEITAEFVEDDDTAKFKGIFVYDFDKGKLEYDYVDDYHYRSILYEGTLYELDEDDSIWWTNDYSDEIEEIIDYYNEYKDAAKGLTKLDWKDLVKEAGLSRYVDAKKLEKCLEELEKNLNSKSYYEKVCREFSVEKTGKGTKYVFDVNIPDLLESLIDTFELVIKLDIDEVKDELLDSSEVVDKLLIEVTIKDNKLAEIHIDITRKNWRGEKERSKMTLDFKNYGKAALNKKEIEKLVGSYKKDW